VNAEVKIIGYCRACGTALDEASARHAQGTIFCETHAPVPNGTEDTAAEGATTNSGTASSTPWTAPSSNASSGVPPRPTQPPPLPGTPPPMGGSPAVAFALGWIPGVGAIYNGQYAKGLIHVVIFGLLVSVISSNSLGGFEPLFGLMLTAFIFYMPFEALHTAKQRLRGEQVDEFSSLYHVPAGRPRFIVGPVLMIVFGVLFLLNNLGLLQIGIVMRRYWPALLIFMGIYLLVVRARGFKNGRE
jgi:hypothetical protein